MDGNHVNLGQKLTRRRTNGPLRRRIGALAAICAMVMVAGVLGWSRVGARLTPPVPHELAVANKRGATLANAPAAIGAQKPAVQAPFDLGAVVQQVHFAFREVNGVFAGGDSSYGVEVEAGRVTLTPYHYPDRGTAESEPKSEPQTTGREQRWEGSPLTLETVAVKRGSTSLDGPEESSVGEQGELRIDRGLVTEVLHNTERGLEQSWELVQKPEGNGDLTFLVATDGHELRAIDEEGLHFAGRSHGLGFVYGNGILVDARGERFDVPARYENGDIVLRIDHELVERVSYPIVLDPTIGPEFDVSEPVLGGAALYNQFSPNVAFDGTNYLVVWGDGRNYNSTDVYGTRVSKTGNVLDGSGILISGLRNSRQSLPNVAFDGTNYLVVWEDERNDPTDLSTLGTDIYGARVSPAGQVLDQEGIAISRAIDDQMDVSLAFDGTNYLVVWSDCRNFTPDDWYDIYGARVSPNGVVFDGAGIAVSRSAYSQYRPSVAYDGNNYLVAWADNRNRDVSGADIYGTRVSTVGAVLDVGIPISTANDTQDEPAVVHNGKDFVVVWHDYRNRDASGSDIYGARVSDVGVVIDTTGFVITEEPYDQLVPSIACASTNCLVTWFEDADFKYRVYGAQIETADVVEASPSIVLSTIATTNHYRPSLAFDGTNYLAVWYGVANPSATKNDVYGARVSALGVLLDSPEKNIATGPNAELNPAMASDGKNYFVVWEDTRSGTLDVYGSRVTASGTPLDSSGIAIASSKGNEAKPVVAFDGTSYLVVWYDEDLNGWSGRIVASRVSTSGTVLDKSAIPVVNATPNSDYAIAFDGANYLVVMRGYSGTSGDDIYGRRISVEGKLVDAQPFAISLAPGSQFYPAITCGTGQCFVTWSDTRDTIYEGEYDIYGSRVSATGTVLDPEGIYIAKTSIGYEPSVASDGENYLVTWYSNSFLRPEGDIANGIHGALISATGVAQAAIDIYLPTGSSVYHPAVAYDGTNYLVAWEDSRNSTLNSYDIYGARVSRAGALVDVESWPIDVGSGDQRSPILGAGKGGQLLLAYATQDLGTTRVHARLVMPDCTVTATSDDECNGVDENCSGEADEGFVGSPTVCGVGACANVGTTYCSAGAVNDGCVPGTAAIDDAICNGKDDDCNGAADEDYASRLTACGLGVCSASGVTQCIGGIEEDSCVPIAAKSTVDVTCDTLDDDCDGAADEDYAAQTTRCGIGACARVGSTYCASGAVEDGCIPGPKAANDATCDGVDDDCDGTVDEDFSVASTGCGGFLCGVGGCETTCLTLVGCAENHFCNDGACIAKLNDGSSCRQDDECVHGNCVDGFCCESACDGQCEACGEEGHRGQCVKVRGAPRGERGACATDGSHCGGSCDGVTADSCSYPAAPTICREGSCEGKTAVLQAYCDGQGACPVVQSQSCGVYGCDGVACGGDCNAGYDCSIGKWCAAGICVVKLDNGSSCGADNQCVSGFCVDGLCCNRACTEQCGACNVGGHEGECAALPAGEAPRHGRIACAGTGDCGGSCDGTHLDVCAYPGQASECRVGSCSGGLATLATGCDGAGSCPPVRTQTCAPYTCAADGSGCAGQCQTDGDCVDGYFCSAGVCVFQRTNGATCAGANECASRHCIDGVCCNSACDGQCAACNVSGSVGICSATPQGEGPRGSRPACDGTGTCAGLCNGTNHVACTYPGTSVRCGEAACSNGIAQAASFCDAAGVCVAGENTICDSGCEGEACGTTSTGGTTSAGGSFDGNGGAFGSGGSSHATRESSPGDLGQGGTLQRTSGGGRTNVAGSSHRRTAENESYVGGGGCDCQLARNSSSAPVFGVLAFLGVGLRLGRRRRRQVA